MKTTKERNGVWRERKVRSTQLNMETLFLVRDCPLLEPFQDPDSADAPHPPMG